MGMEDDKTAMQWLQMIRDCVALSPPEMHSTVFISPSIERIESSGLTTAASENCTCLNIIRPYHVMKLMFTCVYQTMTVTW